MKVNILSKTDTALLLNEIKNWPENSIPKIKNLKMYEIEKDKKFLLYNDFSAIQINKIILPFVGNQGLIRFFPYVLVDMGAIKFVCNGAKLMRPGIVQFGSFGRNDIVVIKDEEHGKALAVGIAIEDSKTAISLSKGYIINNLHYVGDKFWDLYKEIRLN